MPPSLSKTTSLSAVSGAGSKKRKLGSTGVDGDSGPKKYYAVRTGRVPGVYTDWDMCKAHTFGFKGASYKSFPTRSDAELFVAGKNPSVSSISSRKSSEAPKFYAVAVGHNPGVYTEWTECQEQIKEVKGPKYKKFGTEKEAWDWVESNGKDGKAKRAAGLYGKVEAEETFEVEEGRSSKKLKTGSAGKGVVEERVLQIWTDGSSLGNGKLGALAGVGVFFGVNDPRNISEPLLGHPQTNQRAELTALIRALEVAPRTENVELITDSQYSIKCVTEWYKNWEKKGWVKSDGAAVMNRDLVERVRELVAMRERGEGVVPEKPSRKSKGKEKEKKGSWTKFTWVKGHEGDWGNGHADTLAVDGARKIR